MTNFTEIKSQVADWRPFLFVFFHIILSYISINLDKDCSSTSDLCPTGGNGGLLSPSFIIGKQSALLLLFIFTDHDFCLCNHLCASDTDCVLTWVS